MEARDKIRFDGWSLDAQSGELQRGDVAVRLSELPLRLLVELTSHAGQVVTREHLIQKLWPQGVVDFDAGLNTAMRKLRVALDDVGEKPRFIETMPRRGYRFIGNLVAPTSAADEHESRRTVRDEHPPAARLGRGRRTTLLAIVVAAAGAAVALILWGIRPDSGLMPARIRMAILPFENHSPDPDNAFFADGLHEQVITVLGQRARDIEVISRATMTTYKTHRPSAKDLATRVGATHVLSGAVHRDDDEVRLSIELIDARTDRHLWSRTFDRKLTDATTLQSDVAAEVAGKLSSHLDAVAAQAKMTHDLAAFDLYLKARQEMVSNFRAIDRTALPITMLTEAIELDPHFAHAYAERAEDNFLAFVGNWHVSPARLEIVKADIEMARRLAPNDPVIRAKHAPYTAFKDMDPDRALEEVSEGAGLGHQDALEMQSLIYWAMGRPDEADVVCRRILELDPLNESIRSRRVSVLFAGRHWQEALSAARAMPAMARDLGNIVQFEITGESPQLASTFGTATTFSDLGEELRDPAVSLDTYLMYMRTNRRFAEAQRFLETFPLPVVRVSSSAGGALPGLGARPVDEHRAWIALMSGNTADAARYAKGVRKFLASSAETPWNAWFLRMLSAEAALFEGKRDDAVRTAKEALAMAPSRAANVRSYRYRERMAAAVFSWAGAADEAVELLHSLAYDVPVIGASVVARDPFYSIPLAQHSEYRTLQDALEQEIRSLQADEPAVRRQQ